MDYKSVIRNVVFGTVLVVFAVTSAEAVTVSDADLKKVEDQVRQQSIEHKRLQEQAAVIGEEINRVNKEMISTAQAIQYSEDKLSKMERQLELLKKDLDKSKSEFDREDANLVKTLSAIQNLAMKPTESLLVQPLSPVNIIRSAIMLREAVPYLEDNAQTIREHFSEISAKKIKIEKQIAEIAKQKNTMQNEHKRMKKLAKAKEALKNKVEVKSAQTKKNVDKLVEHAKDLKDLLQKLEKQRQKRKLEEKQSADLIKSKQDSINNIASGFAKAKGSLSLPARGTIISHYGEQQNKGVFSKGLTIATRAGAQVISPFDGSVVFAGPFRSYGDMIIVEHDGGYLSLLAGLGSIDVELGQMLLAGEPVGLMPDDSGAELYVEIRKNNQPVNPEAWFKI